MADPFEDVSLDVLRRRTSEKWKKFPPDVLPAFVAEMDYPLAPAVREALHRAVDDGDCGYTSTDRLVTAFGGFARERWGWRVDPSCVFPTIDVMAGIANIFARFTADGDGIVINPPVYPPFFEVLRNLGRRVVEASLRRDADSGWHLDLAGIEAAFENGARGYLLCSPHNPVGRVWSREDLTRIGELAHRYDAVLVADEVHAPMTPAGATHVPLLTLPGIHERSFIVTSASKAWNVPGLKCALIVAGSTQAAAVLADRYRRAPTDTIERIGHFGVLASIAAFEDGTAWLDALCEELARNRALLADLLREHLPRVRYVPPEAGYLAWVDCEALALGGDPARTFLERGRVALVAGADFGGGWPNYVRLNMGTSSTILRETVARMAVAVDI